MFSSIHHSFDILLAAQYGLEEAIMIHHFQYWVRYNKKLGRNFKDGKTWTYQTRKEIAAHFPYWTEHKIRRYIDKLVEEGVIIKGNFNKSLMDNTVWYAFVDEEKYTTGESAQPADQEDQPSGESAQPIPHTRPTESKPHTRKGNVSGPDGPAQGLPLCKKDLKMSKYPLKKIQMPLFNWLKEQNVGSDDETLMYYIRAYTEQRIRDSVAFMQEELKKGVEIDRRGGFFRTLLDGGVVLKTSESEGNKGVARQFIERHKWKTAVVTEKYLRDSITHDDLYFTMQPDTFLRSLKSLHEKSLMCAK